MKITCQSCQSKYNVADEKVQGKIVKIRCRKCGATIVVQGTGGAATNGAAATGSPATASAEADAQWHVNVAEGEPRTMPLSELVEACNSGAISLDTYIWTDGMDDWKPVTEVEAVMAALGGGAGTATSGDLQPSAEPAFQSSAAEESRGAAYEPGIPLGASAFQAPADRPSEPRRAAVAKREARGRDLFGTVGAGGAGEEVQTSAPAVPRMLAGPADVGENKATGERNENSVLFSLAVLTKDADGRSAQEEAPKSSGRTTEDSGLIDLKALAQKAESRRPPAFADVGAFAAPLGFTAPSSGVLGSPSGEPPSKSKLPLLIGGGAGVALLLVLGIVIGVKLGGGSGAAAAASAAPLPIPTATVEPTPVATATAEPSATAAPTASVAAKPKTYGGGGGGGTYHPPAGGGAKPAGGTPAAGAGGGGAAPTPPPTPPPPKKAGSDCGCNGDLMCLMKCSTH
jgi:predicted Zn finger-like uncharacterized protein